MLEYYQLKFNIYLEGQANKEFKKHRLLYHNIFHPTIEHHIHASLNYFQHVIHSILNCHNILMLNFQH